MWVLRSRIWNENEHLRGWVATARRVVRRLYAGPPFFLAVWSQLADAREGPGLVYFGRGSAEEIRIVGGVGTGAALSFPSVALSRLALCEGNAKKPVYMMHKWWARRLGVVFRMLLIRHAAGEELDEEELWTRFYSGHALSPDFKVMDPFLGGGTTLVEAAKQGASCVGIDIDPVACFITELELRPPNAQAVRERFDEIEAEIGQALLGLYRSRVNRRRCRRRLLLLGRPRHLLELRVRGRCAPDVSSRTRRCAEGANGRLSRMWQPL